MINEIYSWFGEVQADGSYPINQDICSRKFEISKVILNYLGLNDFKTFRTKISSGEQKEFMERYNYFKDIFSGKAYEQQITQDNDLYKFIMSTKQQTLSFRSYIIKLCDDTYKICGNAFFKKYPKLKYADEFYKALENKIKDITGNIQYESKHSWPDNLLSKYVMFTNDQLIIIYQGVFIEELKIYNGSGIFPSKGISKAPEHQFSRIKPSVINIS